jgi:hypothetical protein
MKKLDDIYFCSNSLYLSKCSESGECEHCPNRHRLFPTPEQFKEEYGVEYPDDGAVYERQSYIDGSKKGNWYVTCCGYGDAKAHGYGKHIKNEIVCACTPFGAPYETWRPA